MFAEMVTELHSQGLTVQSYLKELYDECVSIRTFSHIIAGSQ